MTSSELPSSCSFRHPQVCLQRKTKKNRQVKNKRQRRKREIDSDTPVKKEQQLCISSWGGKLHSSIGFHTVYGQLFNTRLIHLVVVLLVLLVLL